MTTIATLLIILAITAAVCIILRRVAICRRNVQLERDNAKLRRLACLMADAWRNKDRTTYNHAAYHLMRYAGDSRARR